VKTIDYSFIDITNVGIIRNVRVEGNVVQIIFYLSDAEGSLSASSVMGKKISNYLLFMLYLHLNFMTLRTNRQFFDDTKSDLKDQTSIF